MKRLLYIVSLIPGEIEISVDSTVERRKGPKIKGWGAVRSGARWSLEDALGLRALHINGDLDDYMYFHKQEEQWRPYEMAA